MYRKTVSVSNCLRGLLIVALALSLCLPARAATYYVDAYQGLDTDPGTQALPWKSIDNGDAKGIVGPGDTVIVNPGNYDVVKTGVGTLAGVQHIVLVTRSGDPGNPITYAAAGPGVLIDGGATTNVTPLLTGWIVGDLSPVHDIVIDGFEFTGSASGIVSNAATGITVRNCVFRDMIGSGAWSGGCWVIYDSGGTNNTYTGNAFYNCSSANETNAFWIQYGGGHLVARNLMYAFTGGIRALAVIRQCGGVRVLNNTCDGGTNLVRPWEGSTGTLVTNNITASASESAIGNWDGPGAVINSYNLFYNCVANYSGNASPGQGEFTADPQFEGGDDYRLQPTSPAIDAGTDVGIAFHGPAPDIGAFEHIDMTAVTTIPALKTLADGTGISLSSPKVVTASSSAFSDGSFHIEEPNRASGIKVMGSGFVSVGDRITLDGTVGTDTNGERVIKYTSVTSRTPGLGLGPLGMTQRSVAAVVGLDPAGLLVRISGWVKHVAVDGSYFRIDDGSGVADGAGGTGLRVDLAGLASPISKSITTDQYVIVTGLAGLAKSGNLSVRTIRPRGDADIIGLSSDISENTRAAMWTDANLGATSTSRPFSFRYNGQSSGVLLSGWPCTYTQAKLDNNRTQRTITYTNSLGLTVKCVAVQYSDYPAVEWTVYLKNTGSTNTPLLESIQGLDTRFQREAIGEFLLHGIYGDWCVAESYQPFQITLGPNASKGFAPFSWSGKSTDGPDGWPYWNLQMPGGGVIIAVGWPGQWASSFSRDSSNGLRVVAGQQLTRLYLKPGEEIRTPLTTMLFWQGNDVTRAQNLWRRWYMAHVLPKTNGEPQPPVTQIQVGGGVNDYTPEQFISAGIKPDICWRDAGSSYPWYPGNNGPYTGDLAWLNTGTWEVDLTKYPQGFRPFSDRVRSKGMQFLLWFEPERVGDPNSWLAVNHPEWLLPGNSAGSILNQGNPEALSWLIDHIDGLIKSQGIDWYREDMNGDGPLPAWKDNDSSNRRGITENFYVQGHLAFWDALRQRNPGLRIDSCASGGRRNDLETMRRAVPLLRSDYQFPSQGDVAVGNQGHTYGLSSWLPWYGTGCFLNDPYSFRSFYVPGFGMVYLDGMTKKAYDECRNVAPLMLGDYYPLTPYSLAQDKWIAWQFNRPEHGDGVVQAFRRAQALNDTISLKLQNLDADATYELTDLDLPTKRYVTGTELMQSGLSITASTQPAAVIVIYRKFVTATYYVDAATGNDSNPGTQSEPWKSIDNGDTKGILNPGDTVIVNPGTYNVRRMGTGGLANIPYIVLVTRSGQPTQPITYRAAGQGVVIDGGATSNSTALVSGWLVGNLSPLGDIVIDGFEFKGAASGVLANSASRVTVKNCEFHHMVGWTGWSNSCYLIYDSHGSNNTYTGNVFYSSSPINEAHAVWLTAGCSNITISNNLMYASKGGGVSSLAAIGQSTGTRVISNTCDGASNLVRPWNGSSGTVVTNNIISNIYQSAIGNWDGLGAVVNSYNLFYNCATNYGPNVAAGPGEFTANPRYIGSGNYRLQASSPAIDAGVDVGLPFSGSAPDLGAFEFNP